jgi:hypothetical protein
MNTYRREYTSQGQLVATFDESVAALYRGYMRANPDATDTMALNDLKVPFPKRALALEKMLANGQIQSLESETF